MNRFLVLTVIVFAAAAVLPAATIACPESGALSVLTAMTANGDVCQSQDKIFSNFQYTGTVAATAINFNLVLKTGTSDVHGWSFVPTTAWINGFTLSYTIGIAPGNPLLHIIESKDQINSGATTPPNGITIVDTQTFGILTSSGTAGGETQYLFYDTANPVHTISVATIPGGTNLLSYEQDFIESSVPEPVSFVLIGSGLLGLGLLRRRRKS